jgi:hypothetical protein
MNDHILVREPLSVAVSRAVETKDVRCLFLILLLKEVRVRYIDAFVVNASLVG